ncbi:S8 family peptidase [Herbaspirillum sp. HC18]|nr:S8 family peptidase [Herbaspirillum sp. HC18]
MTEPANDKRPHLLLRETSESKPFTAHSPGGGDKPVVPDLPRAQHGAMLQAQLAALTPIAEQAKAVQQERGLEAGLGLQIQFVGQPDIALAFESLANDTKRIELLSVRQEGAHTIANVFVPDGKLAHFEKYVTDYLEERKDRSGTKALDHKALLNTIADIRAAELRALWTDDLQLIPADRSEAFWWEVWLPARGRQGELREQVVNDFRKLAEASGCQVGDSRVDFPERVVMLMYGSEQQFSQSVMTLNCVAELRRAKETAEFFDSMGVEEQQAWQDELLARTAFADDADHVPRICLLDSGVNRGHALLAPVLDQADLHTVHPAWGVDDRANHGTGLAAVAVYGDLSEALDSTSPIEVSHRLESVKLAADHGANPGSNKLHANLFAEAVSRPEIAAPARTRVFSSAVTSADYRDRGRPSSWSAMVDRLASDAEGNGAFPRLIIQSAGNMFQQQAWPNYPHAISTNLIHDPGQAWNALTVGAYTSKTLITEHDAEGYAPIAPEGGLSPMTSSSSTWDRAWPLKPEVVFEGGNAAQDALGAVVLPSLGLLTAHHQPHERLFTTTNATSAASVLCARMTAQLVAAYPRLRPETIRALIVHAAAWTDAMRQAYLPAQGNPTKSDFVHLIRHCGWGVPDLARAMWSASNSLTLVVEDSVHPYHKVKGDIKTRHMNLHALPWPKDELEALGALQVEMRVTLSYFIEPNPSARGTLSKFHYPSHRLRFDVRRAAETLDDFVARINASAAQEENGEPVNPKDRAWVLGDKQRHRGSLHQDIWTGTAADLANRGFLSVYPAAGWWRTRAKLERFHLPARYSLVVSIRTPETETDLYNAVAQKIAQHVVNTIG